MHTVMKSTLKPFTCTDLDNDGTSQREQEITRNKLRKSSRLLMVEPPNTGMNEWET